MRFLLFVVIFYLALSSSYVSCDQSSSDLIPIINITVATRYPDNRLTIEVAQNCSVINYSEPFKVLIYKPKQIKRKDGINCYSLREKTKIRDLIKGELQEDKEDKDYFITIQKAEAYMAIKWQCKLKTHQSIYTSPFNVYVRVQGFGNMYINQNKIKFDKTPYTIPDYDEHASYSYVDGEMTHFRCIRFKTTEFLKIRYQANNKDDQFEVADTDEVVVNLRLDKTHNNTFLDCIITGKKDDITFHNTMRVFFLMKSEFDMPRFMINEMVLFPVSESNLDFYDRNHPNGTFVYNYYPNETVVIRTLTRNSSTITCSNDKSPGQTVNNINLKTMLRNDANNLKLNCNVKDNKAHKKEVHISLQLKLIQESDLYPLSDLSWANILAKYKKDKNYVVIKYSYSGNTLLLTCNANDKGIDWTIDQSQTTDVATSEGQTETNDGTEFWETKKFIMKTGQKRTIIKCFKEYARTAEIEWIRDGPLLFEDIPETDIMEYFGAAGNKNDIAAITPITQPVTESGVKTDLFTSPAKSSKDDALNNDDTTLSNNEDRKHEDASVSSKNKNSKDEIFKLSIICGATIIALIVVAITICLIMKHYKHKRNAQDNSSIINYENLPAHNDGPMPIPQQWQSEENVYSIPDVGMNVDNLDAQPLPKKLRPSKPSPIYAEAFDYANRSEADYVNTGTLLKRARVAGKDDDSNYSEVYQSNKKVNFNNTINYADIDKINETYAQVEPKAMRDRRNSVSLNNHYGNMNVADDQSSNHDSEPAYTEINSSK